jgi:hypothetical protein
LVTAPSGDQRSSGLEKCCRITSAICCAELSGGRKPRYSGRR